MKRPASQSIASRPLSKDAQPKALKIDQWPWTDVGPEQNVSHQRECKVGDDWIAFRLDL